MRWRDSRVHKGSARETHVFFISPHFLLCQALREGQGLTQSQWEAVWWQKSHLNSNLANLENTGHLASGQVCYQSVLGGIWAPWAGVASWQILTWGRGTGSGRSHCSHLGLKQGTAWLKALWKGVQASSPHGLQLSI